MSTKWSEYPGPSNYFPDRVSTALDAFDQASDPGEIDRARFALLFAIGNTHAGIVYPAALGVVAPLAAIGLNAAQIDKRIAAIDTLIDVFASSEPEEGFERIVHDGVERPLMELIEERVQQYAPAFARLAEASDTPPNLRHAATELVRFLDEPARD